MSRPRGPARSVGIDAQRKRDSVRVLVIVLAVLFGFEAAAHTPPGELDPGGREVRQIYLAPEVAYLSAAAGFDSTQVGVLLDDNQTSEAGIRGFHFEIAYPADFVEVTAVLPGALLASEEHYLDYVLEPPGLLQVDGAVLGATGGLAGQGTLIEIELTATTPPPADDCGPFAFQAEQCVLRDPENLPLTAEYTGGQVSYDITPPQTPVPASPTHPTGQPVSSGDVKVVWTAVLDEGTCPAGVSGYYLLLDEDPSSEPGPGGTYDHFVPFAADSSEHARWYTNLTDGAYYAHVAAYDSVGNAGVTAHLGPLEVDTTAPENVTGLSAVPTANTDLSVDLTWSNPASDFAGLQIFRRGFGNYPEYDDPPDPGSEPPWPASPAEALADGWELVYDAAGESHADGPASRDYYYYAAFAYDAAGNFASLTLEARDASLAYWLGDFTTGGPDVVDIYDILVLSLAYNTAEGDTAYHPVCDIGPTDGYTRFGRPLTDNQIEFDDLILLANNYENAVVPAPGGPGPETAGPGPVGASPASAGGGGMTARVETRLLPDGRLEARVHVAGNPGRLKGASVKLACDPDWALAESACGELWQAAGPHFFFAGRGTDGLIWIDAAVWDGVIEAAGGCHAVLCFAAPEAAEASGGAIRIAGLRARDDRNRDLTLDGSSAMKVALPEPAEVAPARAPLRVPAVFTGEVTIRYQLTQAQAATLAVHDLNGRLIAPLTTGEPVAGEHQVTWDGRDQAGRPAAPGVYFVRLESAGRQWIRKTIRLR